MDELEIKGKKYISSKRASELTGYAKDYVGQLARAGKIAGTRMGRAWYVEEEALLAYKQEDIGEGPIDDALPPRSIPSPTQRHPFSPSTLKALGYIPKSLPGTWEAVKYYPDDAELIPSPLKSNDFSAIREEKAEQKMLEPHTVDIRIKILEEKTKERPVMDTLTPRHRARKVRRRRSPKRSYLALGALKAALGVFLFFFSGFFLSSHIAISSQSGYSANVATGFQEIRDVSAQYPFISEGFSQIGTFSSTLYDSYGKFFAKGMDFLVTVALRASGK